jgi:uncharacterized membrane protein YsdA (DUF1294 family)
VAIGYLVLFANYGLLSLITFCLYGLDKSAARRGRWRVQESTLHFLSLFGGWPGAMLGQKVFRHKTRKRYFQVMFWLTVLLNAIALGGAAYFFNHLHVG